MTTPLQMPGSGSDPTNQTLSFYLRDGTTRVDVSMGDVDMFNKYNIAGNINLSCQIGACILMLVVFVLVTPWAKLCKPANILHILNLATSTVRLILLVVDSISSRGSFYYIWTLDASVVNPADIRSVIAGITLGIVQILFIESALMLQALSLVQLWPRRIKWPFVILSGLVALSSVIFKAVSTIYINIMIANGYTDEHYYLPYRWNTILNAASIFYFTAIFNCRLVHHMWTHRSFLPSSKGLTAMEVLVATNGILMILPSFFAGMQFGSWTNFEAGSLANTLTIIVLPLGTLVAQRLSSNPSHFSTTVEGSGASRSSGIPLRNKAGALVSSWVTSVRRDTATIVSKIEAGGGNSTGGEKMDITDREHRSIEDIEAGSNGIRVNRKLTSREEAA